VSDYLGNLNCLYEVALGALFLQASEQYFTDSQFFSQDFLQVISLLQTTQSLLGKKLLLPLKLEDLAFT